MAGTSSNDDDRGGFEFDLTERAYSLAEILKFAQESFPQQKLEELFFVHAEDNKIIVACSQDAPTKAN